ncbi:MAG: alpha-hydroxy-acid oxidizing protein, partial [Acidobacteria bacterium]|nr:alpha-hydroxy-acid oxidizing protein [Acidobacteriota bacterium]
NLRGLEAGAGSQVTRANDIYHPAQDASLTWRDMDWLRNNTRLPVIAKGILTPGDAVNALQAGLQGITVSNHGARSLDTVPATAEVLEGIADRLEGRLPILVDGGIRRGTDVLKALALGASAVLIGRPYVFALAAAGAAGLERVIEILTMELRMAMALAGRPTLASIDRSLIWKGPPYR